MILMLSKKGCLDLEVSSLIDIKERYSLLITQEQTSFLGCFLLPESFSVVELKYISLPSSSSNIFFFGNTKQIVAMVL